MNKKYLAIPMVIFISLAMVGFAYATWFKWLYINGEVDTGVLCWEFVPGSFFHRDTGLDWTCDPYTMNNLRQLTKDVGSNRGEFVDTDGDGYLDTFNLVFDNVYPCYCDEISFLVENCGTIPLHIAQPYLRFDGIDYLLTEARVTIICDATGREIFEINWGDNIGKQMHPWVEQYEISFRMHILQQAQPGAHYTFEIFMPAVQYNAPAGEPIPLPQQ